MPTKLFLASRRKAIKENVMKTFSKILSTRLWVKYIDDERGDGNSIIVTLDSDYVWDDERDCGVRGFRPALADSRVLDRNQPSDTFPAVCSPEPPGPSAGP